MHPLGHFPPQPAFISLHSITMVNTTEGLKNDTATNKTEDCTLHKYRMWPSSCSETMIFHYKWISLVLGLAFTAALSFHFRNIAVRVIQSKFKINLRDSKIRINILSIAACMCGMLKMSNFFGYHHDDYCISSVSGSLCTSLLVVIA